ncbi:MAG: mandelate racemase/muconate lactonizing enzyme family protein [Alphaproteobacteria bacterium]|nr:mandelate racemase/muconate lactonizing enzyme family protein [Alphaproteobacteria bacterium]
MKIQSIELYAYDLTYAHGEYVMSKGRAARHQPSTLVRIVGDNGLDGWGETATLGGTYLPTSAATTRAALGELAPGLIGEDPCNPAAAARRMDAALMGQANAKSALETACWDLFGKALQLPVAALLGGVLSREFPLYEAVPLGAPEDMAAFVRRRAATGIRRFQLKVGDDPRADALRVKAAAEVAADAGNDDLLIIADANGGWSLSAATIAVREIAGLDVFIEQPCRDLADCALISARTALPMVLDESVVTLGDLFRAKTEAGAGAVNIKLGRVGGIGAAVAMRNTAHALGMTYCIEDMWGGDVVSAAVAQVAASSPPESLMHVSFFNDWTNEHVAGYEPRSKNGRGALPDGPGLGITVDRGALGPPLAIFS